MVNITLNYSTNQCQGHLYSLQQLILIVQIHLKGENSTLLLPSQMILCPVQCTLGEQASHDVTLAYSFYLGGLT